MKDNFPSYPFMDVTDGDFRQLPVQVIRNLWEEERERTPRRVRNAFAAGFLVGVLTLCILAATVTVALAEPIGHRRVIVIDGDTIHLSCAPSRTPAGDPAGLCRTERIRLLNIDAPELSGTCAGEAALAVKARARLLSLVGDGGGLSLIRCGESGHGDRCTDRYGRTLARLMGPNGDLGQILIAEGLAEPWRPGWEAKTERQRKWCGQ